MPDPVVERAASDPVPEHPTGYSAVAADQAVALPDLLSNRRFWRIIRLLISFFFVSLQEDLFAGAGRSTRNRAERLRTLLIELGPTFIKVGQFLSVRRDLLPAEVADELSLLQDQVPPLPCTVVQSVLSAEFGPDLEIFAEFDEQPIASASIGQVHRATLIDGRQVVVKIQRPDLSGGFLQDIGFLRLWAKTFRWFRGADAAQAWLDLFDEFGLTLFREVDYLQEGRNADRIRQCLRPFPQVIIPRVFWKHTTRRALVLEYVPGTKIDQIAELQAQGQDLRELGNLLVECYLQQIIFSGFFHADPHPGNLAVTGNGKLVIYDFGMVSEVTAAQRSALAAAVRAITRLSPRELAQSLADLGIVTGRDKMEPVVRAVTPFFDYWAGKDILELDFQAVEAEIDQIVLSNCLRFPSNLAYLLRASSSVEGVARRLKPNFNFIAAARPVIRKWALEQGLALSLHLFNGKGHHKNGNHGIYDGFVGISGVGASNLRTADLPAVNGQLGYQSELAKLYLLQARLEKGQRIIYLSLLLVSLAILFLATCMDSEWRPISKYILIGNGVLGAIIILVAVKPFGQRSSGNGSAFGKGNGDQ